MGIIAKIWNIKAGSMGRSGGAQISSSIDYITNSEKCDGRVSLEGDMQVGREVNYVTNDIKTLEGLYVGGRNISDIKNAVDEMMQVKEFYGKTDGRVALHGIISLDESESDILNAGKLMFLANELMERIFPEHQVVYAVHTNTENLHMHFIANTVGLDGKKIHMDKSFMRKVFEPAVNELAVKYGFTPNEAWVKSKQEDTVSFKDRKIMLRKAIDYAIEEAEDFTSFVDELRAMDITVNVGKNMSLKMKGMNKAIRSGNLGDEYTIDSIKDRIAKKTEPFIRMQMSSLVKEVEYRDIVTFNPTTLKKYKNMSATQKKEVIHLLKIGRNPWRERYETNWQIRRMSDELSSRRYIYDLVRSYSKSNSTMEAKEKIVELQKEIAAERKKIKENLRKYKSVIDIYEEAKRHENRAYLYEFANCLEYKDDYEKYKELCDRLKEKYSKDITDVAEFVEEQNNQLIYAKSQSNELSSQYKTILKFERSSKKDENQYMSFFEAVGYSKAHKQAKDYGIFETRLVMITAENVDNVKVRIVTLPEIVDGKATVITTVEVLDVDNKVLDEFSSRNLTISDFNKRLNDVKYTYGFIKCHIATEKESYDYSYNRQLVKGRG